MSERVNITKARVELSALMAQVTYESKRFVIERHGKPLGALVSVKDLESLEQNLAESKQPHWALALVGAWRDVEDWEIDSLVSDIYASREKDMGRPVGLES
jgi:prevent-host-death family protein